MDKKVNDTEQFAKELASCIKEIFGTDVNFDVKIETEEGTINFGVKNDECECECKEKKERLKKEEELTIGEKYVLFLLNNKELNPHDVNFDSVINTIINDPLYDFMLSNMTAEEKQPILAFISTLSESIININFNKLRQL